MGIIDYYKKKKLEIKFNSAIDTLETLREDLEHEPEHLESLEKLVNDLYEYAERT